MVLHANNENGTALHINSTVSVLAWCMYFMNYFLLLTNFIRLVALVPLNPLRPHFINFIFLKLSSNAKSSYSMDVGIELTPLFQMSKFLIKNLDDLLLLRFHLSQLAICYIQGIITLHYTNYNLNSVEL